MVLSLKGDTQQAISVSASCDNLPLFYVISDKELS